MILERGNMWDVFGHTDLFLITTNPILKADGSIVMGRGIARQAKGKYPKLPYDFGHRLLQARYLHGEYADHPTSIGVIGTYDKQTVGWFMVKDHWANPADLDIIQESTKVLTGWANGVSRQFRRIDLNFPGIGNGRLTREEVLPIIEQLPDNVHVWEYG